MSNLSNYQRNYNNNNNNNSNSNVEIKIHEPTRLR